MTLHLGPTFAPNTIASGHSPFSLGRAVGSFIGGSAVGVSGCRMAFAFFSGAAAVLGVIYAILLAWKWWRGRSRREAEEQKSKKEAEKGETEVTATSRF